MMNIFIRRNNLVVRESVQSVDAFEANPSILWIDLLHPTPQEISFLANRYELDIPTKEEREEIEESARYWEDSTTITINSYFLFNIPGQDKPHNETVTFILCQNILFTVRYNEFKIFDEIQQRVLASPKHFEDGYDLISKIFEVRVEKDADLLENVARKSRDLRRVVFENQFHYDEILGKLSELQEINMSIRDTLFDKRRAVTSMLTTNKADTEVKQNLTVILKDINSLVEFTNVNMSALDNIQNLFSSQITIEQNKTIKIFTVVTVAMMPPTLIATIYGMNFKYMPELEWTYSYPIALALMVISTIVPIMYFKKKKWLQ